MKKLSVVIITYNEEKHIARCIRSVKTVADEIIVLDSFSCDQTVSMARENGARVYQEPFRGYIAQKNRANELATHRYILSLDADEALDEELQCSILREKCNFLYSAYKMKRCTNHCGRFIRHGSWYPDRKIRLFDKEIAYWGGLNPHDKIVLRKNVAVKQLRGEMLHYSYSNLLDHKKQNDYFSSVVADAYFEAGKSTNWMKIMVNPCWAFFYGFLLRRGFMIGRHGLVIAIHQFHYTLQKHKKLYGLQQGRRPKYESNIQPPAYTEGLPGDVRTHIGSQEKTGMGDIFCRSKTA